MEENPSHRDSLIFKKAITPLAHWVLTTALRNAQGEYSRAIKDGWRGRAAGILSSKKDDWPLRATSKNKWFICSLGSLSVSN